MKHLSITLVFTLFTSFCFTQEKLNIDTSKSRINWIGEYAFYFGGHDGKINFEKGHFIKTDGKITGGEFIIDMNSLQSLDMETARARKDLDNHLKNEDFFEVNKYPTAKLIITKVVYESKNKIKVYADLTIKDISKPINFRAMLDFENKEMTTKFKIDRTLWNITYNSKEIEGKLKDGLISDAIGFDVKLSL